MIDLPLVVLAVELPRAAASNLPFGEHQVLEHWLEPVVAPRSGSSTRSTTAVLAVARHRRSPIGARTGLLRPGRRPTGSSPRCCADGWYYRRARSPRSSAAPVAARVRRRRRRSTARSSTARSTASARSSARAAVSCASCRPARPQLRARHRRRRGAAARLVRHRGRASDAPSLDRDFPILTALVARCPPSAPCSSRCSPHAPPRRRAGSSASPSAVATGALDASACSSTFDTRDGGFQFVVEPHLDRVARHLVAPRRRRHLAVPRRAHRLLFPLALLGVDPHHDEKAVHGLDAAARGRAASASFLALDLFLFFVFFEIVLVPMYFLIGGWGHGDRVYAAMKFFLFTMSARRSCSSASSPLAFLHQRRTAAGHASTSSSIAEHARHRRRPRRGGCSSPSPSRSR